MLPYAENNFENIKKLEKDIHVYISTFYAPTQIFEKWIFFVVCAKRQKMRRERAYFSTKVFHFCIDHIKSRVFFKRLCVHVKHFCLEFV
jgi:adenylate cyclase class IV